MNDNVYIQKLAGYRRWIFNEKEAPQFDSMFWGGNPWRVGEPQKADCSLRRDYIKRYGDRIWVEDIPYDDHDAPADGCRCGLYCHSKLVDYGEVEPTKRNSYCNTKWRVEYEINHSSNNDNIKLVIPGICTNWGKVIVHDDGIKAQYSEIVAIFEEDNNIDFGTFRDVISTVRENRTKKDKSFTTYVPVHANNKDQYPVDPENVYMRYVDTVHKTMNYAKSIGLPIIKTEDAEDFIYDNGWMPVEDVIEKSK